MQQQTSEQNAPAAKQSQYNLRQEDREQEHLRAAGAADDTLASSKEERVGGLSGKILVGIAFDELAEEVEVEAAVAEEAVVLLLVLGLPVDEGRTEMVGRGAKGLMGVRNGVGGL